MATSRGRRLGTQTGHEGPAGHDSISTAVPRTGSHYPGGFRMRVIPVRLRVALLPLTLLLLVGCGGDDLTGAPAGSDRGALDLTANANAWTTRAPMPTARSEFAIAAFTNPAGRTSIYVFGGLVNGNASAVVEAYDPATNTWTRKASMPVTRFLTNGATVIGSKIYVVGGWRDIGDISPAGGVYEYTPATNSWRTLPPGRFLVGSGCCGNGASGTIGGKLYVYEGNDGVESSRLEQYDPATRKWAHLAKSNDPHDRAAGHVLNGLFYVFGPNETIEAYDPTTDTWSTKTPMSAGPSRGTAVIGGRIYVFGGSDSLSAVSQTVSIYDPALDSWDLGVPMTTPRTGVGAAAVTTAGKTVVYVIGGSPTSLWTSFLKKNELFDPTVPNKPPVAVANGPYAGAAGTPIQFSALGTFDPEGAWNGTWAFGDGSSYTGVFGNFASQNPLHTYPSPGAYSVTFTVTDASGASTATSATANIQ